MIVLDASTLILLTKADLLEKFLDHVGQQVAVPAKVERESCRVKKSIDALMIQKAIRENRISVRTVKDRALCSKLQSDFGLGGGEAEAMALALSERATLVGIDDRNGIHACKLLKLGFTTAIGILVRMQEKGLLQKEEAVSKLGTLEQYGRYSPDIVADAHSKLEGTS